MRAEDNDNLLTVEVAKGWPTNLVLIMLFLDIVIILTCYFLLLFRAARVLDCQSAGEHLEVCIHWEREFGMVNSQGM